MGLLLSDIAARSGVQFGTSGARGLVTAMTADVCFAYVQGFLRALAPQSKTVVIGHDLRPSSPMIAQACAAAVVASGRQYIYAGELPTPALAYYGLRLCSPVIVVTGSHIPFDRNGIKFYTERGEITKAEESSMMSSGVAPQPNITLRALPPPEDAAQQAYLQRYIDFFGSNALQGLTIAVYQHSSVARDLLPALFKRLGAETLALGRTQVFVPIDTEAVRQEDRVQARAWAKAHRFDALVSTDGDADRPLVADENGEFLRGDILGVLVAATLKAGSVVTPVSSNTVLESSGLFPRVLRTKIGSPYVLAGMELAAGDQRADGPVVGYEANGGFLLGSDVLLERTGAEKGHLYALPTRDAVLPILAVLSQVKSKGQPLSVFAGTLPPRFTASDRLQAFASDRSLALLQTIRTDIVSNATKLHPQALALRVVDETDGLRMTFENGEIIHLRPSGNAPELRCYTEADSDERAQFLCAYCLEKVGQ